jgi:hypothetical protein
MLTGCEKACGAGDGADGANEDLEPPQPVSAWAIIRRTMPTISLMTLFSVD